MDINHPLYSSLKNYYTNLDLNSSNIDNNLLFQYIEDTCGIDNYDSNFIYFKLCYSNCKQIYFVNFKTSEIIGK